MFDTSNVTSMSYDYYPSYNGMFKNCSSLTSLDLSSFDLSKVASDAYGNFLTGCTALTEIKSPKINPKTNISLPSGTWTDDAGTPYTTLPTTTGISITLTKTA